MKWPQSWIADRTELGAALKNWCGATAQAWEYSIGHSQFLLRLHRPKEGVKSLFLYFKGCERVSFTRDWEDAKIDIEEKRGEFVVSDGDRLLVHARVVVATEWPDYGLSLRHQIEE